ncbi:MAG: acyl-CoA dehydrogenase family protein [Thermoflexus sp.]|nr:acyl-CoA dehydrogenase family protein [Thermoflexus sp.]
MNFELSEEHRMFQQVVREFAQKEIAPAAARYDETGEFPWETVRKMAAMGLMGLEVPEEYGGQGLDAIASVLAKIEIAKADAAHSTIMSVNNTLFCFPILTFGTEEQKRKYVTPVATGQAMGAYALTEPQAGSDAASIRTRAARKGDVYIINGRKSWITNGPVADYIVLFAVTDPERKHRGISAFIIETNRPGFSRGKKEEKLGIRASATCEIYLDNYECPVENRLGEEGAGFRIAMTTLDAGRVGIAAQAAGIAEAAYEAALAWAKQREAFGHKIGEFQAIQWKLADMRVKLEAARLLTLQAAWKRERAKRTGERYTLEAAMAKLFASEAAQWITYEAIQIHGGMGYSREMPVERYFRDARITTIYEGTSEIQRLVIARQILGFKGGV